MEMFQVGDKVVYGIHGVCRIVDTEEKTVDRKKVSYFVLEPMEQPEARFYVPMHNEAAVSKLRRIMSAAEIHTLLRSEEARGSAWICDENQRKLRYRSLINSGDRSAMLCMIRTLHQHKSDQEAVGRKLHMCDENFLRDAQKLLGSEFSLVLGIPQDQVGTNIQSVMQAE